MVGADGGGILSENDFIKGSIDFSKHRGLSTKDVFIVVQILKRCAKTFLTLVEKWERGEEI